MDNAGTEIVQRPGRWHIWVVGVLSLLWNGMGALTVMMAQSGKLPNVDALEASYYAAQPFWFMIATNIALLATIAAALALLIRSRFATWLYAFALVAFVINNVYDLAAGTSLMLVDRGWLVMTCIIATISVLQLVYAWTMKKRGVLS